MHIVEIIESLVVIAAVLVGGGYAIFKLDVFRDLKPHLTVTQTASHRSSWQPIRSHLGYFVA